MSETIEYQCNTCGNQVKAICKRDWPPEQPQKTLRDEIAIEAMWIYAEKNLTKQEIAMHAYETADAMIMARDAKPKCQHERTDEMYLSDPPCYRYKKCGEFFRHEHNSCKT
jgi:hypothetical protein